MFRFILPSWVKEHNFEYEDINNVPAEILERIQKGLKRFQVDQPLISIVIPAYNEEKNILRTLSSLSRLNLDHPTELLVVNNNSTDKTQQILDICGVRSIFEPKQGISFTRQTGLENARGKYIMNADADSIYPANWVNAYYKALQDPKVTCVHGRHSFIPSGKSSRATLGIYEVIAESFFNLRSKHRDYFNVLGFNFAFRKEDGLKVGGFNTTRQRWQDGWMAMMLKQYGQIKLVPGKDARVWTSDRRLMYDGGLFNAFKNRIVKYVGKLPDYLKPTNI
jgi:glycosyltransferase involved in cell wall biosynthesis